MARRVLDALIAREGPAEAVARGPERRVEAPRRRERRPQRGRRPQARELPAERACERAVRVAQEREVHGRERRAEHHGGAAARGAQARVGAAPPRRCVALVRVRPAPRERVDVDGAAPRRVLLDREVAARVVVRQPQRLARLADQVRRDDAPRRHLRRRRQALAPAPAANEPPPFGVACYHRTA